ncbi:signal peptidase I [Salinibacterium sp.]|uniref:signal peptidase I n=1 Tax=Salinibacterium sp. TaxID=1915057 RepID=UPI00286CC9E0|nr:signal peptidase I [Salinibacterium sp.]
MTDTGAAKTLTQERSLWYYLGVGLSAAMLIIVVTLAVMIILIPKASGSIPLTVLTSSMEPGLPPGTLIIVRPIDPENIVIGTVVTYQIRSGEPDVITHRVMEINTSTDGSRSFIFKGDNNSDPDPDPVLPLQIKGDVWYSIPWVGWVNTAINGSNRPWIVPVVAAALFGYAGFTVVSAISSRRRRTPKSDGENGPLAE